MSYSKHVSTKTPTPQTEAVPGKDQIKNDQGGYVFKVSPLEQFKRFLILGSQGGTYYASEKDSTIENAKSAIDFIRSNGLDAVNLIVEVSDKGRAVKNDPAIFLLALCCTYGDAATKQAAYAAITKVCRIGTHIFQFCQAIQDLRGWSNGLRRGVAKFYTDPNRLVYQLMKYRQRDGWTHRDVLRLVHPKAGEHPEDPINELLMFAADKWKYTESKNEKLQAFENAKTATGKDLAELITDYGLSWEMLPTEQLKHKEVWTALLPKMGLTAMLRNLARMTANNTLADVKNRKLVCDTLTDKEALTKARIHPIQVLTAIRQYAKGKGDKGNLEWSPIARILDTLEDTFEMSFQFVEPTGKRFLLGLDVSGSMEGSHIAGISLTAREAAACLALVTAKTEDEYTIMGFSGGFINLPLTKKSSFKDAMTITRGLPFDHTDCSLPMLYAQKHKLEIDCFAIYTDSETGVGSIHPFQALQQYRKSFVKDAKLVVVGMTANQFSIADPSDAGMMDVVGFDTATPKVISEFAKG